MAASVSSCSSPDTENLYGLTWQEIFAIRDRVARRYFYRCQQYIPLEEFQSAGNEAICLLLREYQRDTSASSALHAYLYQGLRRIMFRLRREQFLKYASLLQSERLDLFGVDNAYAVRHDFLQCLRHISTHCTPRDWEIFCRALIGEDHASIADKAGLSVSHIRKVLWTIKQLVQDWTSDYGDGESLTTQQTHKRDRLTKDIQRLKAAGHTGGQIARQLGYHPVTINRHIRAMTSPEATTANAVEVRVHGGSTPHDSRKPGRGGEGRLLCASEKHKATTQIRFS